MPQECHGTSQYTHSCSIRKPFIFGLLLAAINLLDLPARFSRRDSPGCSSRAVFASALVIALPRSTMDSVWQFVDNEFVREGSPTSGLEINEP